MTAYLPNIGKRNILGKPSGKGCEEDPTFMYAHCPHSCGICPKLHIFADHKTDKAEEASLRSVVR